MKSCSLGKEHQSRPWSPATNAKINRVQPTGLWWCTTSTKLLHTFIFFLSCQNLCYRVQADGYCAFRSQVFWFNTALKHMIARFSGFQEFSVNICVCIYNINYYIVCKLKTSYLWYLPTCVCNFPLFSCRPPWFVEVVGKNLCGGPSNWAIATPPKKHTQKKTLTLHIHTQEIRGQFPVFLLLLKRRRLHFEEKMVHWPCFLLPTPHLRQGQQFTTHFQCEVVVCCLRQLRASVLNWKLLCFPPSETSFHHYHSLGRRTDLPNMICYNGCPVGTVLTEKTNHRCHRFALKFRTPLLQIF